MKNKYSFVSRRASRRQFIPGILGSVFVFSMVAPKAQAELWVPTAAGTTYQWGTGTNWNPATVPNSTTAVANINNNILGAQTINLATGTAANRTVNDLNLGDSDSTHGFTIAPGVAGSLLILGGTNPSLDITGNIANTISAGIRADANVVFRSTSTAETTISAAMTAAAARNITFNNDINGTATAAATSQGQIGLTAANTLYGTTGTTSISDVRVRGNIAGSFGANAANSVTVSNAGQLYITGGTHVNNLVLNSTGWVETAGNLGALRIENATVSGTVALQQTTIIGVNANNTGTLSGVVSGGFGITKVGGTATSGQGELLLSGVNTFTGPVTVAAGAIRASNASALGTNTTVTVNASPVTGGDGNRLALSGTITIGAGKTLTLNSNGTGDFRSMLISTANDNTWAGNIVVAGTGLTQVSAASGATLRITGGITSSGGSGTGTLFSRGVGTVVYNGVINLGSDRIFNKTDAGTVIVNSTGNSWVRTQVANGQIQIGANNALASTPFSFGENSATNNGRLELNGFSQTLGGISTFATSTAPNHILRNSNLTSASTLTFSTTTTDILKNVQIQGTATGLGTLNLIKNGTGRTDFLDGLVAANSWTVNDGTIAFTGTTYRVLPGTVTGLAAATIEKAGASTLLSTSTWNNAGTTNVVGGTLALGAGTAGAINVSDGATLATGLGGSVLTSSAVTFGTAGVTTYSPILTNAAVAPLTATTLTNAGSTVTVAPQAGTFTASTTYRLLDYTNVSGLGGFMLAVGSYPHIAATLDTSISGQVNLVVGAVDSLIWAGQTNGVWDVNTTSNFALASSPTTGAPFYQGDAIVFGDTADVPALATTITNRTITGSAVTIGNLSFNNSLGDYSIANVLSGLGTITKAGTSALTLSGANTLGGGAVNVTGGTLKIGNADALRGAGLVTVSGGGTFDGNGINVITKFAELIVSGSGVGDAGAIVNNGAGVVNSNAFAKITLTGDTTWGGTGRYDVNNTFFNGGSFTLTKVGAGELYYVPTIGSTLENVVVNGGIFGNQSTNALSSTATVTVNTGGTHTLFGAISAQHNVVLTDGGTLNSANASPTLNGSVTLSGTGVNRFIGAVTGTTLNLAGKLTGTGGFTVNGAGGTVQLQNAANDYAGDTVITLGTLNFSATGIVPATTNLIVNGVAAPTTANSGTFATGNIARTVASLSGSGGIISGGNVLTTNQSTSTVWNGNLNGTTAQMSGGGSLTLGGTGDNNSGIAIVNSGTLIFAKGNTTAVAQAIHSVGGGGTAAATVNGGTLQLDGTYNNLTSLGTGANAAPAGTDTLTYVDQIYNGVGLTMTAGTFDLNGRQEAINGAAVGAAAIITNTASGTTAKLYIGHQNGIATVAGAINDTGTGLVAIEKIGTSSLTLSGTSNFTGGLTQTAGTVTIPIGATLGNTPITVTLNTFTFDGTHGTGAIALNGTSVFVGAGTSGGILTAATGTTVQVGTASGGTAATTLTIGGLTLTGGTNLNVDYNTAGTTLDKVATTVSNGLSISGANPLNVVLSGAGWVPGTYPLLTYVGAVQGTGATNATLVLSTPVGHSTVNVVDDLAGNVNLVVSGAANKWVGGVNNTWDTNTTLNWNSGDQKFLSGDTVVFDNTATTYTPNILANQTPAGVTFDNTTPYTLSSTGAFGIAGTGGLIKTNTGTVTISSANTYTGATDVQQGTLIANYNTGTTQTVFAAASTINVALGATFGAVANDGNVTLANNLTGSGLVVIDPHLTAGAAVRDVAISGTNTGFTGTLRLSPTVIGDGSGTFRTNAALTPAGAGGATIDVDAGSQAWLAAGTFPNNFILTGHGYAETAAGTPAAASGLTPYSGAVKGGIGAIRMSGGTISGNVTLDGSAKITPYNATGTISGSIGVTNPGDILSVGGINTGTSILILTGTNNVGANALNTVFVNAGGTAGTNALQIGSLGTTGTLGTGNVTLYNDAAGARLTIQRSDGYTLAQNVTAVHDGTATNLTKANFVANTQGTGVSVNGYTIDLTDGTNTAANAGTVFVAGVLGGSGVNNAILNIDGSSTVKTGQFFICDAAGFSGTVNQSGTSSVQVASHVRVGHYGTSTNAYNISAGTLTVANINTLADPSGGGEQTGGIYLGVDGTGTMAQSGSTVTTDWIVLDNRGDTPAGTNMPDGIDRYTLTSGTLILRSQWGITQRNTSTAVTLGGGTIQNGGTNLQVRLDMAPDVSGAVTLDAVSAGNSFNLMRSATGIGSLALTGGGTLKLTTATTQSIAVPVSGTGALEKLGIGITTLGIANTYNGTTTISAGTLQVGAANALPSGASKGDVVFSAAATSSVVDLNGFDVSINALSQPISSTANLVVNNATGTNKTLTLGNNDVTATFAGIIANNTSGTGTLALTKTGTGTQTLSGTSTFTGPITVNGGQIGFPSSPATSGPLGNSTVINLDGGGLSYTASGTNALNRSVAIGAGNGTFDVASVTGTLTSDTLLFPVTSTGGNLIKTGAGTLALSGTTMLNGGAGNVTVSDGTLQAGFGPGGVSAVSVAATGNFRMQNSATENLTLANTAGALTLAGGSRLGFEFDAAANDRITVGATGTPVTTAGVVTLDLISSGAGIASGNTYTLLSTTLGDLTSGGLTSYVIGTAPSGFNYTLTVTAKLVKVTVEPYSPAFWTNSQTTGSWSTLNGGTLSNFSTDDAGTTNFAALPAATETVNFSATPVAGPIVATTLNGSFTIYDLNFLAGAGTVTDVTIDQGSSGTLSVQPTNATGGIDVGTNAGNVTIGAPLVASSTASPSQTWNVDGTGANSSLTLNGVTTFAANVIKSGAGALTLGNAGNTGAGNFTLGSGTLKISATGNLPTGVFTIGSGTTIDNTGAGPIALSSSAHNWNGNFTKAGQSLDLGSGAVTMGAAVVATIPSNTLTVGGGIDDGVATYGLTKADVGNLVLNGGNSYDGVTTMNAGVLTLAGNNSGASGGVTLTAGQLNINSDGALGTGRLTLSGGTFDNTDALAHTQAGNPAQTWTNAANIPFTGTQALNLGTGAVTLGTDATTGSFTLTNNSALPGTSLTVGGNISAITGGTAGVKTLTIAGAGSTALTGNITRGSATALDVTVTSGGTTTLSGPASSIRTININGGASSILDIGAGNLTITNGGANGFVASAGGTINATGGGKIILGSDLLDNGTANGTTLTVNAGITGPFTFEIYAGGGNTGVTVLTAQNTFTGNVQINGGNLSVSNIGNTGSLTSNLGSGTSIQSGAAALVLGAVTTGKLIYTGAGETTNRVLTMTGAGFAIEQAATSGNLLFTANVAVPNAAAKTLFLLGSDAGTGELGGVIPNNTAATSVTKLGTGAWTLSGANTYTGNTTVSAGSLTLSGARTATTGGVTVGNQLSTTATLNVSNGTFTTGAINVGSGDNPLTAGIVNQTGGTLTMSGNQLLLGNGGAGTTSGSNSTGTYNLSSGQLNTIAGSLGVVIGVNTGATGVFNLSGTGVLNMPATSTMQIARSDSSAATNTTGTFNQTGGTATVGILQMSGITAGASTNAGGNSTLSLTGGTFAATTFSALSGGNNSTSTINIGDTAQVTLPVFPTNAKGAGSTRTITFDSTTGFLSPLAASATYLPAGTFDNAYLTANGAKFNVGAGKDITIGQKLENAPAATGTLTKQGLGVLTLTGANDYTGDTTVSLGTLALVGGTHASPITVSSGASLGFTLLSPTTSTSTFNVTLGTIKITGTPTLPSYTLISSSAGITGTPVLDTPIAGYFLKKVGNTLVLESPYEIWAVATGATGGKTGNPDGDALTNLQEYAFGTDPTVISTGPITYSGALVTGTGLPVPEEISGVYYALFGRRTDYLAAGLTYTVQFSAGLDQWTPSAIGLTTVATDGVIDAVRIPFPNLVPTPSGPKKPAFFRVVISD
jgi:autotransporter-associated beta strand protein